MRVLGITDSITSGAALVEDGRVLSAVSEERLDRQKMSMGFPWRSIDEVLKTGSTDPGDLEAVAVATNNLFWQPEPAALPDYFRQTKGWKRDLMLGAGSLFSGLTGGSPASRKAYYRLKSFLNRNRKSKIKETLESRWGYRGPVVFIDHHLAHCASAYYTSGLDRATVISLDGAGDFLSARVYRVKEGRFEDLWQVDSYDSIGNYYGYVTHLCGFKAHRHEGKILGLAAFGEPAYLDLLRRYLRYENGTIKNVGGCFDISAIKKLGRDLGNGFSKKDLAASIQYILEEIVTNFVDNWVEQSGFNDVLLSGGVAANVKLNQRINELERVNSVFIHPGMGDEGLAVGAAQLKCFELCQKAGLEFRNEKIEEVYWGPGYSEKEMEVALREGELEFKHHPDIEARIAGLLAQGKVVARFDGRMEYGPRALGNRSILYQPTDPTVNEWLNKKLDRTEFMPFAPVTLMEYADQCYLGLQGAEDAARFMTITFDCTDRMKESCPAVVHVDGTARPQLIDRKINPSYYDIVDEYRKLTDLPTIINTSFNMHEEPIVCTPAEAVRSVKKSKLDALAMGNFLTQNSQ